MSTTVSERRSPEVRGGAPLSLREAAQDHDGSSASRYRRDRARTRRLRLRRFGLVGADGLSASEPTHGRGTGHVVVSQLIAGIVAYGAIGWLAGRAVGVPALFPVGMFLGLGISTALVIYRYGRSPAVTGGRGAPAHQLPPAGERNDR